MHRSLVARDAAGVTHWAARGEAMIALTRVSRVSRVSRLRRVPARALAVFGEEPRAAVAQDLT